MFAAASDATNISSPTFSSDVDEVEVDVVAPESEEVEAGVGAAGVDEDCGSCC